MKLQLTKSLAFRRFQNAVAGKPQLFHLIRRESGIGDSVRNCHPSMLIHVTVGSVKAIKEQPSKPTECQCNVEFG